MAETKPRIYYVTLQLRALGILMTKEVGQVEARSAKQAANKALASIGLPKSKVADFTEADTTREEFADVFLVGGTTEREYYYKIVHN